MKLGNALDTVTGSFVDDEYAGTIGAIAPNLPSVIDSSNEAGEPWYQTAAKLATTLLMTNQQRQLLDVQIERARAGLPPLDVSGYTGLGVNVGISSGTQKTVLYAVGALAAVMLVKEIMRGRRG